MENINLENTNSENPLEQIDTPLDSSELTEFQENLDGIKNLPEKEKDSVIKKVGKALLKIPGSTIMIGGAVVSVASLYLAGDSFSEVWGHSSFDIMNQIDTSPEAKEEIVFQMQKFLTGCYALVGSLVAMKGGKTLNDKVEKI